jgi:hypothetical protein
MEGIVNLITLLGAAAACKDFCELLLKDPTQAAQLLGIVLTQTEVKSLEDAFAKLTTKERQELCSHLSVVANMLCKHPPCPFVPVIPGKADFCKKVA